MTNYYGIDPELPHPPVVATGAIKMITVVQMVTLAGLLMVLLDQLSTQMLTETQVIPVVTAMEIPTAAAAATELVQLADLAMDSGVMANTFLALRTPVSNVNSLEFPTTRPSNTPASISQTTTTSPSKPPATMSLSP